MVMCGVIIPEEVNHRVLYREGFNNIKRRLSIILATPTYSEETDINKAIKKLEELRSDRIRNVKSIIDNFFITKEIYGENERFLANLQKEKDLLLVFDPTILFKFIHRESISKESKLIDLRGIPQIQKVLQFYGLG